MFAYIEKMKIAENKKIINKAKLIYVSSIIFGIIAHGMMMFNQYSYHDNVEYFKSVGATYTSGRWTLEILGNLVKRFSGNLYSLPLINGLLTILFIASIAFIISLQLRIESNVLNIALSGILVTSSAVTGIMGFMFTAPYYYFATLMAVVGAYIFAKHDGIIGMVICTVLMACSVGVYQAIIPVSISVLLLFMLDKTLCTDFDWKEYIGLAAKNVGVCVASVATYTITNELYLKLKGSQLADFKTVDTYGMTSIKGYILRIIVALKEFLKPTKRSSIFVLNSKWLHILLLIAGISLAFILLRRIYKQNKRQCIQLLLIILCIPLAAYFIFVMVDDGYIAVRMTFGEEFTFVLLIWMLERISVDSKLIKYLKNASIALIFAVIIISTKYSNICYAKANLIQSQAVSYFTTLVTRIKSCEGYDDEIPVVYLNDLEKEDLSFAGTSYLIEDSLYSPYFDNVINDYAWKEMMKQQCGFAPVEGDATIYEGNAYVENMPSYPDDGSIQIIDGQVVVKF